VTKLNMNDFKNQIVFFGFCPGADFSRRLDTRWKELGICEFQYFESKVQVKRFASIEIGDLIVLKKRQIIGKTMRVYGYGLVTGITKDDKGNRVLKVDWSSQEQVIEVPLLGCNATIDIRDIDKVRADMPDAFFEWLKKGSSVAGPLKAATKEDANTSKLRFNHSKDKDSVVDKTVDKSLAGVKKTTDYSKIFSSEEWQTLKLGFAWSMLGIANVNGNGAEKKDEPGLYLGVLLSGSFDEKEWFKEFDLGLVKQLISPLTNKDDWDKLLDDYLSGPYRSEEGMKEVGQILRKYLDNEQIGRKVIDGYIVAIGHGMQSMVGGGLQPSNNEFSFYTDMICQMKDGFDGQTSESSSLKTVMNGLKETKKLFSCNQKDKIKHMFCNHLVYIAYHHIQSGNFNEALQYYQEALPVSKELAEKSERVDIKNDYRSLLDAIAGIYEKQGNDKDARSYYQLGLDMAMELADKYYLRMTYVKLIKSLARFALFEKSQGNFNGALEKFTQCIPLISEASANFNDDVDERFSDLESFVLSQIDDINKKTNLSADKVSKNEPEKPQKSANKLTPLGLNPDVEIVDINAIPRTDYSDEAPTKSREASKSKNDAEESEYFDEDSTESELLDAAKSGNVNAMEFLGLFYMSGKWGSKEPNKAYKWNSEAAVLGGEYGMLNTASMILLGQIDDETVIGNNSDVNNPVELVLQYLNKLSIGSTDASRLACYWLGNLYVGIYEKNVNIQKDLKKAKEFYEMAVKKGCKESAKAIERLNSQNNSSEDRNKAERKSKTTKPSVDYTIYENTKNIILKKSKQNDNTNNADEIYAKAVHYLKQKDPKQALKYMKEAAKKGSAEAMYELGASYTHGYFSDKDYKIALKYYQEAADLNYTQAMHNLAIAYSLGRGIDVDYDIAFKWFKKAAANFNIESINALGVCYEKGQGVDVDLEKAVGYFETAMNNGHVLAARNIANYYYRGKYFEVDRNKAADIWESLALAGDILSAKDIGICYENGHGRDKDLKQARAWYKIAADGGNEDAIKYLKELN
jgi:TPR repeat protein